MLLFESALAVRKSELGDRHPHTATSMNNLAGLYESMGQYDRALPLFEQAVDIAEEVLGPEHPNTKVFQENLRRLREKVGIENCELRKGRSLFSLKILVSLTLQTIQQLQQLF